MSYGVIASKSGHVQLETVAPTQQRGYGRARERYRQVPTVRWQSGRVVVR